MQSPAAATHELEGLLERRERIIALHTPDPEGAIVEFRLICRRSGRSIYYWSGSQGMVSLKASDISRDRVEDARNSFKVGDSVRIFVGGELRATGRAVLMGEMVAVEVNNVV